MSSSKAIVLKSSDEETFEVEETVAVASQTIKSLIDDVDGCADASIPLPNVASKILSKVIEYCKNHVDTTDQNTLFDLILAANYLNIKGLLDLTCQTIVDMIKGKTPEQTLKL